MDRGIVPYLAQGATLSDRDEMVSAAEVLCKTFDEKTVFRLLGVEVPPAGQYPVLVGNTVPRWDDTMVYDAVAIANAGGGHFVVGYPDGVKDRESLAREIGAKLGTVPGLVASAEPIEFCMMDAVDVVAEKADGMIGFEGQEFVAVKNFSYRIPMRYGKNPA